jgi:hypothetical protein
MLALAEYRDLLCSGCGGYLPDTTGKDAEGRFEPDLPIRCHQCTARMEACAAHMNADHSPHPQALMWPVSRRG